MASYPIDWEPEIQSQDKLPEQCPYTALEMEDYLFWNHYHWSRDEEPTHFKVTGVVAELADSDRRFWLYEARDVRGRQWLIVVGSGKSPFSRELKMRRWMYGESNDLEQAPDEFLLEAYRQQVAHDSQR